MQYALMKQSDSLAKTLCELTRKRLAQNVANAGSLCPADFAAVERLLRVSRKALDRNHRRSARYWAAYP